MIKVQSHDYITAFCYNQNENLEKNRAVFSSHSNIIPALSGKATLLLYFCLPSQWESEAEIALGVKGWPVDLVIPGSISATSGNFFNR